MESSVRDPMVIVHVILISVQVCIVCVLFGKLMLRNPTLFTVGRCHFCLQASKINPMSLLKTLKLIKKLRSLFHRHHDCIINALEHHSGTLPSIKPCCSKESEASAATHHRNNHSVQSDQPCVKASLRSQRPSTPAIIILDSQSIHWRPSTIVRKIWI